jgi:hypothetical protein
MSHPRKKNQRIPARTKWTIAKPRRPCKSWPKPGMKKLHSAANTLPPDPGPAMGLSSRTEHVVEEQRRLYSKCWCDGRRMGVRPRLPPCGGRWRDRGWCGINRLRRSLTWTGLASARQPERLTNNSRTISAEPDVHNALSVHREGVSPR